jgi:hypothetical protein
VPYLPLSELQKKQSATPPSSQNGGPQQ